MATGERECSSAGSKPNISPGPENIARLADCTPSTSQPDPASSEQVTSYPPVSLVSMRAHGSPQKGLSALEGSSL